MNGLRSMDMKSAGEILRQVSETMPETPTSSLPACALCGEGLDRTTEQHCPACRRLIERACEFNRLHYTGLPPVFAAAGAGRLQVQEFESVLLIGPPRRGKTFVAHAALAVRSKDPRVTIAAYSWPRVLMELRRGFDLPAHHAEKMKGYAICDALREADVALIDDLGAEKITESNTAWIQQELFVILDTRWLNLRQTLLTTNLWLRGAVGSDPRVPMLDDYLGERIIGRVREMCRLQPMTGRDRSRQQGESHE